MLAAIAAFANCRSATAQYISQESAHAISTCCLHGGHREPLGGEIGATELSAETRSVSRLGNVSWEPPLLAKDCLSIRTFRRDALGLLRNAMCITLGAPSARSSPARCHDSLRCATAVAVLVTLADFFLARSRADTAARMARAAGSSGRSGRSLRHVHDQPVSSRTDTRVANALFDQILAAMRSLRLAARTPRRVSQLAGRGDLLLHAGDI